MVKSLSSSAQKVQDALNAHGLPCEVFEMPDTTRTAHDAAQAAGCEVGQIVKSLVFKGVRTNKPYIVLASGANVNMLVLDTEEVLLKKGDMAIQRGTNHAWSNRSGTPCVMAVISHGGKY